MVKYLIILMFFGCGTFSMPSSVTAKRDNKKQCSVTQTDTGAIINCPDGTTATINNGNDGVDGNDGSNGMDGADGQDGNDGIDGQDGEEGAACSVEQVSDGALITCGEKSVLISLKSLICG